MTTIFRESFETDGNGTRYTTSVPEFTDGAGDFFTRTDGTNIGGFVSVTGADGAFWFGAMDTNGEPQGASSVSILFEDIAIAGYGSLVLAGLFAEDDDGTNEDWDADSRVRVEVSIDGGPFRTLLQFAAAGGTNTEPRLDTDFDGIGDGPALTAAFAPFSAPIADLGAVLDMRIVIENLEAGDEDIAIDALTLTGTAAPASGDLFISEYVEGSSFNKAIEIFNGTGATVDLSASGYTLELYSNGASVPTAALGLTGTVADGDVFVLAHPSAAAAILAVADATSGSVINFNGDDAVVLRRNGAVVDAFGQIGVDPGTSWPGGGANVTLQRKATVTAGDTDAGDAFDASVEWDALPQDTFSGLGAHTTTPVEPVVPVINEFVANHTGSDTREYIEVLGAPNTGYASLTILQIEGDDAGAGVIDSVIAVGTTDAAGFWATGFLANEIENGTQTLLLVEGFTGTDGADLDTDNDGVFDITPWTAVLDSVAVSDGGATDRTYASAVLAPLFDGQPFTPGGASRIPDGTDTGTAGDWVRNDFDLAGIDGFTGSPDLGEALNTPGAANALVAAPPPPAPVTLISAVQGAGAASPLVGRIVTVEAIVVGDFQNGDADTRRNLGGFYLQEEDADADGDPLTSEGLFVFQGGFAGEVNVGDKVRVTGTVAEFFGETQLDTVTALEVVASAQTLPTAAEISLPAAATSLSQDGDAQPDLEAFEGMLVTFPQTLTITEQFQLDRFNEIKLVEGARPQQFTQTNAPDPVAYAAFLDALGARTITYDDGLNVQNAAISDLDGFGPVYDTASAPRMGDTVTNLSGVLDYKWAGNAASGATWRVRATQDGENVFDTANPRPARPDVGGSLTVASFNVLNFFTTLDLPGAVTAIGADPRGADNLAEFDRQLAKLVTALSDIDADLFGLVELENDFLAGSPGNAIEALATALSVATGDTWAWADPGRQFVGTDAIAVGFLYNAGTLSLASPVAMLTDADLAGLGLDFGGVPVFDGVSRVPVAASFQQTATGEVFTATVNHFKSKGSPGLAGPLDSDRGDGAGNANLSRLFAAQALDAWLDSDPTGAGDPDVLILGDLNAYAKEDPITFLEGTGGFTNLVHQFEGPGAYGYVFDGQTGTLDYALATGSLTAQVTGAAEWRINADEADALDYNLDFGRDASIFDGAVPFRAADHDPVIVGLDLFNFIPGTAGNDRLSDTAGTDVIDGLGGRRDVIVLGDDAVAGIVDTLVFGSDGKRGSTVVEGFDPDTDVIRLTDGQDVVQARGNASGVTLRLSLDGDTVVFRDIHDAAAVLATIEIDHSFA